MRKLLTLMLVMCTCCALRAQVANYPSAQKWSRDTSRDPMNSTLIDIVSKSSTTQEEFSEGYHPLRLLMKNADQGLQLAFMIHKVMFLNEPSQLEIRLDGGELETYTYYFPRPGDYTMICLNDAPQLVKRIQNSHKMLVRVRFYAEGSKIYQYYLDNCPWQ